MKSCSMSLSKSATCMKYLLNHRNLCCLFPAYLLIKHEMSWMLHLRRLCTVQWFHLALNDCCFSCFSWWILYANDKNTVKFISALGSINEPNRPHQTATRFLLRRHQNGSTALFLHQIGSLRHSQSYINTLLCTSLLWWNTNYPQIFTPWY